MNYELFEWRMLNGDHGDHAFAECKFGMRDFAAFPFDNAFFSKIESPAKPFDHCSRIAIYDRRHHRFHIVGRAAKYSPVMTDPSFYLIHSQYTHFPLRPSPALSQASATSLVGH
jgi:hypothetical protein